MSAIVHKARLILAGVLIALGAGALAQVSSPPFNGLLVDKQLQITALAPKICMKQDDPVAGDLTLKVTVGGDVAALKLHGVHNCTPVGAPFLSATWDGDSVSVLNLAGDSVTANGVAVVTGRIGWARVEGDDGSLVDSGGFITSSGRNAEGLYSVNFTKPGSAIDFACTVTCNSATAAFCQIGGGLSNSDIAVATFTAGGVASDVDFHVTCMAD